MHSPGPKRKPVSKLPRKRVEENHVRRAPQSGGNGAARLAGENDLEAGRDLGNATEEVAVGIETGFDECQAFQRGVKNVAGALKPGSESLSHELQFGADLRKVPGQAGAKADCLLKARQ